MKVLKSAMAEWFALRGLLLHIWMAEKDILNAELTLSSDWIELLRCGNMHVGDKEMSSLWKQWSVSLSVSFCHLMADRPSETLPDHGGDHRPADQGRPDQTRQETLRDKQVSLYSRALWHKWLQSEKKDIPLDTKITLSSSFYRLAVTTNTSWRRRGGRSTWGRWRRRRTWSPRSTDSTRWPWCSLLNIIRWWPLCRGSRRRVGGARPGPHCSSV